MALSLKVKKGEFLRIGNMVVYFKNVSQGRVQVAVLGDSSVRVERIIPRENEKNDKPNHTRVMGASSKRRADLRA